MNSLALMEHLLNRHDVRFVYSMLLLGFIGSAELPQLADGMLADHQDSWSILQLSLCRQDDTAEIESLVQDFVAEFKLDNFSEGDAIRYLAKVVCAQMVSGNLSALEGAKFLWDATLAYKNWDYHDLDAFVYAASEAAERPSERNFFESAILKEARRWLEEYSN